MYPKYILEPYKNRHSRYACPQCHQPFQLARYIDLATGNYLADHVGRCNRENKCGYHYTPSDYFRDNPDRANRQQPVKKPRSKRVTTFEPTKNNIPREWMKRSWRDYESNNFVLWLCELFQVEMVMELVNRFRIGSSRRWPGATVFWQIDRDGIVRAGKIMCYDPKTGKRTKDQNDRPHIDWVHSILTRKKLLTGFQLNQCFFGEHQLNREPIDKPIAIVESEKTAIIGSVYLPDIIWMAAGQMNGLTVRKFRPLAGREITLYPDLGLDRGQGTPFQKWQHRAKEIQHQIGGYITVSDALERHATTEDERQNGYDLADYLVTIDPEYKLALKNGYPVFWDSVKNDFKYDVNHVEQLL